MNIFVAKLNFSTSSESLQSLFEEYGEVSSAKVILDHESGRSKGFGFVEMPNDEEATEAIRELNDSEFDGRTIVVKKARPRSERDGGGGGGHRERGGGGGGYNRY
jgi:RNA recognition motif-containing protein